MTDGEVMLLEMQRRYDSMMEAFIARGPMPYLPYYKWLSVSVLAITFSAFWYAYDGNVWWRMAAGGMGAGGMGALHVYSLFKWVGLFKNARRINANRRKIVQEYEESKAARRIVQLGAGEH